MIINSDELVEIENKMKWFNKKDSGKKESNEGNLVIIFLTQLLRRKYESKDLVTLTEVGLLFNTMTHI